jgi:serine/threonine protein kinase/formylglycine-generating enzyme required for sulfatase activity
MMVLFAAATVSTAGLSMTPHPAYELFEELGRGTNTVVYRAYDLTLGREVAIKELDETGRRDPRHRERFLREAQFLAQFEHDNVLRVYAVDTDRGWIIMELMKGTLASKIDEGPSDPDLVRSILKQTLGALAFLHDKQKVHGTVRPTNLLINELGRVKLSEFEQTAVGGELRVPTGSKKYLAPELIRPEFGEFGPPTDLYCLGFTALELLKGPQFEGLFPGTGKGAIDADIAWLRWHSSPDDLASVKKLVKGIPDDLAHVLDRMLKKRVADRAQTAQEILKELDDRPLVPVPVAGGSEVEGAATDRPLEPGKVRELAPGQKTVLPPSAGPAPAPPVANIPPKAAPVTRKHLASSNAAGPPKYSKDWFNQQLGKPYVLYPLCAAMLLGALWYVFRVNSGSAPPIPVTFAVQPDAAGLEVVEGENTLKASPEGTYPFAAGPHKITFRKEGFHPKTQDIDVSQEKSKFAVQLEPIIKWIDVTIAVTPATAKLTVDGKEQPLSSGTLVFKYQEDKPLNLAAESPGFVSTTKSIAPADLAKLSNKVTLALEREKPKLPESLVAKAGAELDAATQLPVRALAAKLGNEQPLEFALVKPGTYSYGTAERPREGELPKRTVEIREPLYVALNEITNAQYQQFAGAAGETKAGTRWQDASKKWAEPLSLDPLENALPVTNVSSAEAAAFCAWLGGRLPTEIEWESAVRGPNDRGYPLPWGADEPTRERCQIFFGELGPVAVDKLTASASPLGLLNAIGNAAEWCESSEPGGGFVLRGCSFATANLDDVRVTWRRKGDARGEEDTGFRVVVPITTPAEPTGPVSSKASEAGAKINSEPNLVAPIVVLFSLPWDSYSRRLGLSE